MPRNITTTFRKEAEAQFSGEADLCFLTISHGTLSEPIRVVWDTKDYVYGGETFTGFPFEISILSDDEAPPKAQLAIQNIDPRIGDTLRTLTTPPRLKIELLSTLDFDTSVDPRTELSGETIDPDTVLLLHCDGSDTSTTFTDSSDSAHTMTVSGNAQIDTAESKFGGASGLFDGTGDFLSTPSHADFTFGTGDFDISFWLRLNALGAQVNIFGDGAAQLIIYKTGGNVLRMFSNGSDRIVGTTALTTGVFYHVALARASGSTRLFLNGTQEGSTYADSTNYSLTSFNIGSSDGATFFLNGWLDEIRVMKGSTDHTATFTPPTSAYGTGSTVLYSADRLFLINARVDFLTVSGQIVGWDYLQRVWPGQRATQAIFPGLFR